MHRVARLLRRLRAFALRRRLDREMEAEMRHHLEMEARDLVARGVPAADADRLARVRFGGVERFKEAGRDARGLVWLRDALRDARQAARSLFRDPGFAAAAIVTLALGVGASTAIFSAVYGVLLRPLPYEDPDRLVRFIGTTETRNGRGTLSFPDVLDWRDGTSSFTGVAAYDEWSATIGGDEAPERIDGASVTSGFFDVLGATPALGRFFLPREDDAGHDPAVVLSHALWQRRYGADPNVIGRMLRVGTVDYRIVGVAGAAFEDPGLSGPSFDAPALWRVSPPYFDPASVPRGARSFTAIGRLRPGIALERARKEVSTIAARLAAEYPSQNAGHGVELVPLKEQITAPSRPALLMLLGATGLLVLLACANVANLLVARGAARERELALRAALGAERSRLVRQLLAESALLAIAGGALGVAIAAWASPVLVSLAGDTLARAARVRLDGGVLAFAAAATMLTALVFGLAPALHASLVEPQAALKDGARGTTGGTTRRFRDVLVAAEVAIAVVLLVVSGLLLRSLWTLQRVEPGFTASRVLTLVVDPPGATYDDDSAAVRLYERLEARLAELPGVERVGVADILPMSGSFNGMRIDLPDRPAPPHGERPSVETRVVTPGFFSAVGIPLVRGRGFTRDDGVGAPEVAIVDEATAARFWPGDDPIGQTIIVFDSTRWRIVGVVGDVRHFALDQPPEPTLYLPRARAQQWATASGVITVRGSASPSSLVEPARRAIRSIDPGIAVSRARPLADVVGETVVPQRLRALLLAIFAAIAFVVGAIGIYGVVAHGVSRRLPELGIRIALGADRRDVLGLVMRQGLAPVAVGLGIGLLAAAGTARLVASLLFGVSSSDPTTFVVVVLGLGAAAIVAAYLPARRALRVDPMTALRAD
ncbi:MAG TPA: ABC transporter permease [Gemmatimonadaceae bacterium]